MDYGLWTMDFLKTRFLLPETGKKQECHQAKRKSANAVEAEAKIMTRVFTINGEESK